MELHHLRRASSQYEVWIKTKPTSMEPITGKLTADLRLDEALEKP